MVLCHHDRATELDEVAGSIEIDRAGVDAWSLVEAARRFGLEGEGVRLEDVEALELLSPGSILHWQPQHYVVLESYQPGRGATILDPAYGRRTVTPRALARGFSGIAILLTPGPEFQLRPGAVRPVPRRQFMVLRATYWLKWLLAVLRASVGLSGEPRRPHSASSPAASSTSEP